MAGKKTEPDSKRQLFVVAAGITVVMCVVALWIAVHQISWLGPRLHGIGVMVFGRTAMGWIERVAYAADSGWNKLWGIDERPEAFWNLPASSASASVGGAASGSAAAKPALAPWTPHNPGPMVHTPFSRDDGMWFPILDERDPGEPPAAFRITLHPDGDRADAVARIAALDLRRTEVGLMPGSAQQRTAGMVPREQHARLFAVITGGSGAPRTGLGVGEAVVIPPGKAACGIARESSGALSIGFWAELSARRPTMQWWRQTSQCPLERGELQPGIRDDSGGAGAGRRAALGLGRDGAVLYVAIAESMSDGATARAMRHAGAWSVARLDGKDGKANLFFYAAGKSGDEPPAGKALMEGDGPGSGDYVVKASAGEFFYVLRRTE